MMKTWTKVRKMVAGIVAFSFFWLSGVVAPAQAALIGTAEILAGQDNALCREKVAQFLERRNVAQHLKAWGITAEEAQARVDTMTDEEVRQLSAKIDQLPAGGDGVGFVLAVAFVAFVTLIITDIIGVTDVFTFIKKR